MASPRWTSTTTTANAKIAGSMDWTHIVSTCFEHISCSRHWKHAELQSLRPKNSSSHSWQVLQHEGGAAKASNSFWPFCKTAESHQNHQTGEKTDEQTKKKQINTICHAHYVDEHWTHVMNTRDEHISVDLQRWMEEKLWVTRKGAYQPHIWKLLQMDLCVLCFANLCYACVTHLQKYQSPSERIRKSTDFRFFLDIALIIDSIWWVLISICAELTVSQWRARGPVPKLDRWASSPVAWAPDHTSFVEREIRSRGSWNLRDGFWKIFRQSDRQRQPWNMMKIRDIPWYTLIYLDIPWYTLIYLDYPWYNMYKRWKKDEKIWKNRLKSRQDDRKD